MELFNHFSVAEEFTIQTLWFLTFLNQVILRQANLPQTVQHIETVDTLN